MLNILICDDDVLLVQHLRGLVHAALSSHPHRIDTFSTAAGLRQAVHQGMQADLAILDIRLEGENNGIQLAKELFPEGGRTQVIFLTAYLEFCSAVYETDHVYFLLKPVDSVLLQKALEKAIAQWEARQGHSLVLQNRGRVYRIPFANIRYLESQGRKVVIFCSDRPVELYGSLTALMPQMPVHFLQCHKSFCINMDCVREMRANFFLLDQGERIPISQSKKADTRARFLDYLNHYL